MKRMLMLLLCFLALPFSQGARQHRHRPRRRRLAVREAGCGLCCPAEDDKGLADIILQFSGDKENRRKYGDNAKAYYETNFSSEAFFRSLLKYLE